MQLHTGLCSHHARAIYGIMAIKQHFSMHLMQLHNLVDLLLQHLQAALGELCFCCITQRIISQSQAVYACNASSHSLSAIFKFLCGNASATRPRCC